MSKNVLSKPVYVDTRTEADKQYGLESEELCLPILKEKFDKYLMKNTNQYAIFDYIGGKCFVELKTRRFESTKYPDMMIGVNKINSCLKVKNRDIYFCFKFTDGLYYWEFHPDKVKELDLRLGGRIDRGVDERRPYYFIKTADMIKIDVPNPLDA
jgi:hypothetical protein